MSFTRSTSSTDAANAYLSARQFPRGSPERELLSGLVRRGVQLERSTLSEVADLYEQQGHSDEANLLRHILSPPPGNEFVIVPREEIIIEATKSERAIEAEKIVEQGLRNLIGQEDAKAKFTTAIVTRAEQPPEAE